jgi:hypothetical protein
VWKHESWVSRACTLLSIGLLPESALAEQLIREPGKDVHLGQPSAMQTSSGKLCQET